MEKAQEVLPQRVEEVQDQHTTGLRYMLIFPQGGQDTYGHDLQEMIHGLGALYLVQPAGSNLLGGVSAYGLFTGDSSIVNTQETTGQRVDNHQFQTNIVGGGVDGLFGGEFLDDKLFNLRLLGYTGIQVEAVNTQDTIKSLLQQGGIPIDGSEGQRTDSRNETRYHINYGLILETCANIGNNSRFCLGIGGGARTNVQNGRTQGVLNGQIGAEF